MSPRYFKVKASGSVRRVMSLRGVALSSRLVGGTRCSTPLSLSFFRTVLLLDQFFNIIKHSYNSPRLFALMISSYAICLKPRRGSKESRSDEYMFRFDPGHDETYVGNIIKTDVSSNICFSFDPALIIPSSDSAQKVAFPGPRTLQFQLDSLLF